LPGKRCRSPIISSPYNPPYIRGTAVLIANIPGPTLRIIPKQDVLQLVALARGELRSEAVFAARRPSPSLLRSCSLRRRCLLQVPPVLLLQAGSDRQLPRVRSKSHRRKQVRPGQVQARARGLEIGRRRRLCGALPRRAESGSPHNAVKRPSDRRGGDGLQAARTMQDRRAARGNKRHGNRSPPQRTSSRARHDDGRQRQEDDAKSCRIAVGNQPGTQPLVAAAIGAKPGRKNRPRRRRALLLLISRLDS
jgi:hypothetical protein